MERLKNKTILVGREPGQERLLVAVKVNGQVLKAAVGSPHSVLRCVSCCKPGEGVAHCEIKVDAGGKIMVSNMKPQNFTYVNDAEIQSKEVSHDALLALGKDKFQVQLPVVLDVAKKLIPVAGGNTGSATAGGKEQPEYSIKPLERVYNKYHDDIIEIKKRQKNIGLLSRVPIAFTMVGGLVTALGGEEIRPIAMSFTAVAIVIMVYGFILSLRDKSIEEMERITEEFQQRYVCPNPKCRHFMGMQPYNILRQTKNCMYCKCKFTEK